MQNILLHFLDFLFPPSLQVLTLRNLSPESLLATFPPAPANNFPFITSLFAYKDPVVSEFIWSIKYKKDKHLLKCAGFALFNKLNRQKVVLVPVPISKKRRRERGYNQCELLIDEIIKLDTENKFQKRFDILSRARDGGEQKLKGRVERLENKNTFSVHKIDLNDPIIIIDDVTTTGSTLKEACDALLSAGYQNVTGLTLAH